MKILDNSHVALQKDGALLYVAGVDYPEMRGEGRTELMAQMVHDAFDGIPEDSAKIFLAHHSDFIDAGFKTGRSSRLLGIPTGRSSAFWETDDYAFQVHKGNVQRREALRLCIRAAAAGFLSALIQAAN